MPVAVKLLMTEAIVFFAICAVGTLTYDNRTVQRWCVSAVTANGAAIVLTLIYMVWFGSGL